MDDLRTFIEPTWKEERNIAYVLSPEDPDDILMNYG
jgi:hypothetical protein